MGLWQGLKPLLVCGYVRCAGAGRSPLQGVATDRTVPPFERWQQSPCTLTRTLTPHTDPAPCPAYRTRPHVPSWTMAFIWPSPSGTSR